MGFVKSSWIGRYSALDIEEMLNKLAGFDDVGEP